MRASILIVARDNPAVLWAQIEALVGCDLPGDVEVVIVDDASGPQVSELLRRLEGDVTVRRSDRPLGRRAALAVAADAASAPVCVALAPVARPRPGFVAPLLDALAAGATLAAPVVETGAGDVHGYRRRSDGSLWPIAAAGEGRPDALGLDCLGARRGFWLGRNPALRAVEGHLETALADAARGRLAVATAARVRRASEGPPASVVVCTRDRAAEAVECVRACAAHGVLADGCELIVVDNGTTPLPAESLPGAVVVREPQPGLSRARNAGAAAARTGIVVYLDDDARPAPGWLEHVRDAFCEPGVALAGGPIHALWPPERPAGWPPAGLESAFSILDLGDCDQDFPGRGEVYGANWAIRAETLAAAGGFDPSLGAGEGGRLGGEEFLVATRVHGRGLGRARYVAGAGVGHRIEPGRIDEAYVVERAFRNGAETVRYAEAAPAAPARGGDPAPVNPEEELGEIASSQAPLAGRVARAVELGVRTATADPRSDAARGLVRLPPPRIPAAAGPAGERVSVLFFYPELPAPGRSAGHARAWEIAFALAAAGYRTTLACEHTSGYEAAIPSLEAAGIEVVAGDRAGDLDGLLRRGFDVAVVSFHNLAARVIPVLRAVSPRTRIVVDSVDIHYLRMERAAAVSGSPGEAELAARVRRHELAVYAAADLVLAVTEVERATLAGLLPVPVDVVGNVHHVPGRVAPAAGRGGALFIGSYAHAPNVDAVSWLCDAILPRLAGRVDPVVIAGAGLPPDLAAAARAAGATAAGYVESVEDELAGRRMSIAPLRYGAGLKGKVGEAMAAGVPVVGTSVAAEGFDGPERGMIVADTAAEFAEAMARLARDDELWARLSAGGREIVADGLGPAACRAALERVITAVAA